MHLTKQLNNLLAIISKQQLDVVSDFLTTPIKWGEVNHGDRRKLAENISAIFLLTNGSSEWQDILEAHRKYFDLHCTLEGNDIIVSKPVANCTNIRMDYNNDDDYILYNEKPLITLDVPAGTYCLISPDDAHMALYGNCGFVKKIVFKIPVILS